MNPFRRRIQTAMQQGGGAAAFSPTDIAGLKLWLDASQITGLNDGDAVATWSDVSGNGRDFTQGTASARPIYKTAILNGKPVVRFDGIDDKLSRANFITTGVGTTFAVARRSGGSAGVQEIIGLGSSGGFTGWVALAAKSFGSANWGVYVNGGWNASSYSLDGVWSTVRFRSDGSANFTLATNNGTPETITGAGGFANLFTSNVGDDGYGQYLSGDVACILHYDTQLSVADMNLVEAWLLAQYAHY
jgi:hypothetical protein